MRVAKIRLVQLMQEKFVNRIYMNFLRLKGLYVLPMFDNASNCDLIVTPDPNIKETSEVSTSEPFLPRAPEIHGVNNLILSLRRWQLLYFESILAFNKSLCFRCHITHTNGRELASKQ